MARPEKILTQARELIAAGKTARALSVMKGLGRAPPTEPRTLLDVAEVWATLEQKDLALAAYRELATTYRAREMNLEAVSVLRQMLRLGDEPGPVHHALGDAHAALGAVDDALEHYESALRDAESRGDEDAMAAVLARLAGLEHGRVEVHLDVADAWLALGEEEQALASLHRGFALARKSRRFGDVVRAGERLLALEPEHTDAAHSVARVLLSRGESERALSLLVGALPEHPRDVTTLELLGRAFLEMGRTPGVTGEAERVFVESGLEGAWKTWRRVLGRTDDAETVVEVEADWVLEVQADESAQEDDRSARGGDVGRMLRETHSYLKYGLRDKAVKRLQEILRLQPEHMEARETLCDLYRWAGHYDGVVEQLRLLVTLGEEAADDRVVLWRRELETLAARDEWSFAKSMMVSSVHDAAPSPNLTAMWGDEPEGAGGLDSALLSFVREDEEAARWRPRGDVDEEEFERLARPRWGLYAFLRRARAQLFDDAMERRVIDAMLRADAAPREVPPAQAAMMVLLQLATAATDADAAERSIDSERWRCVLDRRDPEAPLLSAVELGRARRVLERAEVLDALRARTAELATDHALFSHDRGRREAEEALGRITEQLARFSDDDEGFEAWLAAHPDGFVFNHPGGKGTGSNSLHRAGCRHLARKKGARTRVEKVCCPELEPLAREAVRLRGDDHKRCRTCRPD